MNELLAELLQTPAVVGKIRTKLPPAFEIVAGQAKGPEIGVLREQVIIGMLIAFLGEDRVGTVTQAVNPDVDCYVDQQPLSIKTVTGLHASIRLKWTANAYNASQFINNYQPSSDLLIVRIVWDGTGHVKYVPIEVQNDVYERLGTEYLDYRGQTNTRGVNLSREAATRIDRDIRVITVDLDWPRAGVAFDPYTRWVSYWRDP